jgi:hypothetical protein
LSTALLAAATAGERACRDYERGRIGRSALAAAIAELSALHRLFAELEEMDSPDPA